MLEEQTGKTESAWEKALADLVADTTALDNRIGEHLKSLKPGTSKLGQQSFWDTVEAEAKRIKATLESYRTAQPKSDDKIDSQIRYIESKIDPYLHGRVE